MQYCPACGDEVVPNLNSPDCDFLLIEEFPELILPAPAMVSKYQKDEWTPKKILVSELAKVGMVLQQFHVVSVYPHLPPEDGMPLENCYNWGGEQAVANCDGRKGIIVLGGNLCKTFTNYELKQVQGLSGVPSIYDIPFTIYLPTIRTVYSVGAGEIAIGLQRFAQQVGAE